MKNILNIAIFVALTISCSCSGDKKPPVDLSSHKPVAQNVVEVPYEEMAGVKTITAKLNGVSLDMIFDTGCSGISLSLHEFETMYKNGKISLDDVVGESLATIADGSTVKNYEVAIREVEIGGRSGVVVHIVTASVTPNQTAPVLLGNNVFNEVASVEVDNTKQVIRFKKR